VTTGRKKRRSGLGYTIDAVVLFGVAAALLYLLDRVQNVMVYDWYWGFLPEYIIRFDEDTQSYEPNLMLKGIAMTFRLAIWSMVLASIIGVALGVMRTMRGLFPRLVGRAYVELVRNMPPVVFIFIFYFFISSQLVPLLGIDEISVRASPGTLATLEILFGPKELFSNIISGIICLALFEAAYIAEIVRAGIQSISRGQFEAGRSIGLNQFQVMRYVVLPQAVQRVLPPLAGQFITLIKDSSIVALISIQELTFLAQEVAASTQYVFEVWIFVAGVYFVICYSLALVFKRLENRMASYGR
jgi:polar amino acid transport system permease protein